MSQNDDVEDYQVPPKSWDYIEQQAQGLRRALKLNAVPYFPVMDVLERVLHNHLNFTEMLIAERGEMGAAEGYTCPRGSFIMLREDVYTGAWEGDARARFTVAHELGHLFLHRNVPLARIKRRDKVPAYARAEPQANTFAAALLMPRALMLRYTTVPAVQNAFGVSKRAAEHRLRPAARKRGPRFA